MTDKDQLKRLTELVQRLVDNPVAPVAPVLPLAPILPVTPANPLDHDLLTKLDAKVDQIQIDVTSLKNQGNLYITQADHKTVLETQEDHEQRLRVVEKGITQMLTWGSVGIVVIEIIGIIVDRIIK
jgi:hypothetical protein